MSEKIIVVLCTCPDPEFASDLASILVDSALAACCNIIPAISSVYRWQGQVETSEEVLMLIKTTEDRYPALEEAISAHHPYELPEIIAVPVINGLPGYLSWVGENSSQP